MKSLVKIFSISQVAMTLLGFGILYQGRDFNSAASFSLGAIFVWFNVLSWAFLISRILKKKLIALSATIIVFKYAILGFLLYKLLTMPWLDRIWFSLGLGSLIVSSLLYVTFAKSTDLTTDVNDEESFDDEVDETKKLDNETKQ